MKLFVLLIVLSFAAKQSNNVVPVVESNGNYGGNVDDGEKGLILVKMEEDEYVKVNKKQGSSQYIGVSYNIKSRKWRTFRRQKKDKKIKYNGCYDNEEAASHASDTLARKLNSNGEHGHKLNFPDDETEVLPEKTTSSQYIGVSYHVKISKWQAKRHSKHKKKILYNGSYENEETAAHASDTLARQLMENGEQSHRLNFPDDDTEVFPKEETNSDQYIGVSYDARRSKWQAKRYSKHKKKIIYNGTYKNKDTAAHASDTLTRQLMANGEQNHKLNFPDDATEVLPNKRARKRKRSHHEDLGHPKNN